MAHNFKVGDRVKGKRTSNPSVSFTGKVVGVSKDHDVIDVKTDATKNTLSRLESTHAKDAEFIASAPDDETEEKTA
jgi:hypothetical protein